MGRESRESDEEYAAMSKDRGRYSWSAAHPAYAGTSLCLDLSQRGGDIANAK